MTTELYYLSLVALLTAVLWIPYIACQVMTNGNPTPQSYVDPTPLPVPNWGKRANRAYMNSVETFGPFAALVLVVHLTNSASGMTAFWCMAYFWLRVIHAIVFWLGIAYVRTIVFTLAFICILGLFWEIMT